MKLFMLAVRQTWRELSSVELYTLFLAVLIAVASSSTIAHFAARLQLAMELRASEFLGADLVVSGSIDSNEEMLALGKQLGLQPAHTIDFASMLAHSDEMELASIKAVDDNYPLRGQLAAKTDFNADEITGLRPQAGQVWLEATLFERLGLKVGQQVEIGATSLTASHILTHEPDRGGTASFMPRAMINLADLDATQAIQPGSRVNYRRLWLGDKQALADYQTQIKPLLAPQQKIERLENGNQGLSDALQRAGQYLNLASLAAILLASVSIALSAANFAQKRFDHAALLRCFGLSRRNTLLVFLWQLLLIGVSASLLGLLLGVAAQHTLFFLLAELLPKDIPDANLRPAISALFTGMVSLLGFGLPPLLALGRVAPLRVLRRDLTPAPLASWLVYALAVSALALLMWQLSLDIQLVAIILGGGLVFAALLGGLVYYALRKLGARLARNNLAWRLALGQLLHKPMLAIGQILAFALIIFAMALIVLLRSELLDNWQQQLPKDAANHFVFNIMPTEKDSFLAQLANFSPNISQAYPMTPGRLTHINSLPVLELLSPDSRALPTVQRDLNLTYSQELPDNNIITNGKWWTDNDAAGQISIEQDLADRLGVKLSDVISFNIGGQIIHAEVTSMRKVDWSSMQPNFFIIFAPGSLSQVPYNWVTSFYLPDGQEGELRQLQQQYPAVSLLRIEALLSQLRAILAQVTLAVEFILLFVLAAGITVLLAGVQSTLSHRIRQGALLRSLGGRRQLVKKINYFEFASVGLLSGILAWAGCELTSYLLYSKVFNLAWQPHLWLVLLPMVGVLLISSAGNLGSRRVLAASPLRVLREL